MRRLHGDADTAGGVGRPRHSWRSEDEGAASAARSPRDQCRSTSIAGILGL